MLGAILGGLIGGWVARRIIKSYQKDSNKTKHSREQLNQSDEELITTILPVINNKS